MRQHICPRPGLGSSRELTKTRVEMNGDLMDDHGKA